MKYRGREDNTLGKVTFNKHEDLSLGDPQYQRKKQQQQQQNNKTASCICAFIAVEDEDDRQLTDRFSKNLLVS